MASNIKIKTVEQLEELLVQDLAWRKKEMISLKILVEKDKVNEPILLRAGIALLCAHFEGFIKRASNCYVGYVSQQKKLYSELKENFTALKMEKEFKSCSKSDKHSVHKKLLILHKELLTKRFIEKYDENNPFISTHSNPSSAELEEILETIGIESDIFETKATYIDSSLLEKRHKVVHGERSDLDKEDFLTTIINSIKKRERKERKEMSMSKTIFRELLDKEASPALGCTEPMMFALAGAITRKHAPGKVLRVDMVGCGLMVTGVQAVGIPNTGGKTGAFLASAVGIVNGDAEACKEVLHNIRPEDVVAAEELIQNAEFTLDMDNSTGKQVYFKLTLTTDEHVATVIFEDEHHTWTYLEADGKVLVDNRKPAGEMLIPANDVDWDVFTIENIYNWCKTADISEFGRAKEAVEMNTKVATDGLENPRGIQTARILRKNVESGFVAEDEITHVLMWGTAGADARMGGSDYPTMVSTASGNQGLMVVMAPWASSQYRKMSAEDGYRAVAFALLMNTFMKYASKEYVYMPPTCSCATTAAPAAAAGVAFLHGLTPQQINDMLCTAQVQMAGVVCDGAKPSCATRMYVALFGSLQAMMMAKEGIRATNVEGFVHNDLKVTLENLYRLQHDVLHNKVDAILWDIVKEQKVIH